MCCDANLMQNITISKQPFHVALPNNQTILVNQLGTVTLSSDIILYNVLLVPQFNCNLLSVSKFAQDSNCLVTFTSNSCLFQDQNQVKTLAAGTEQGGIFFFNFTQCYQFSLIFL